MINNDPKLGSLHEMNLVETRVNAGFYSENKQTRVNNNKMQV